MLLNRYISFFFSFERRAQALHPSEEAVASAGSRWFKLQPGWSTLAATTIWGRRSALNAGLLTPAGISRSQPQPNLAPTGTRSFWRSGSWDRVSLGDYGIHDGMNLGALLPVGQNSSSLPLPLLPLSTPTLVCLFLKTHANKNLRGWTSLVVQWLRICLPMQGPQVWSLVWEDPTCCGATKPVCLCPTACAPQEKPAQWEDCALQAESSPPCSLQVEKAWVEQWRVSRVKNK